MLFAKKTVDSILSSLNQNITDLRALSENERSTAAEETERAKELAYSADERRLQADRADGLADKLAALVA